MKSILTLSATLSAVAFISLVASGCLIINDPDDEDANMTCRNFDSYLYNCTANCEAAWSCQANYHTMSFADQIIMDKCSDCLVANVRAGYCDDCAVPEEGVHSCTRFMERFLGSSCW